MDVNVGAIIPISLSSNGSSAHPSSPYLATVAGKPLFFHAFDNIVKIDFIKKLLVLTSDVEIIRNLLQEDCNWNPQKVSVLKAEKSRHRSIKKGIEELRRELGIEGGINIVLILDGAQPLINEKYIRGLVIESERTGAAAAVKPVQNSIVHATQDFLYNSSLDPANLVSCETPQVFQLDQMLIAYSKCSNEELDGNEDCLQLLYKYCSVRSSLYSNSNDILWKILDEKDIYAATGYIREKSTNICVVCDKETETVTTLMEHLKGKVGIIENLMSTKHDDTERTFNTVILFHNNEIREDYHLLDIASMLDLVKKGLIIHIIDNSSAESLQDMTVYDLHTNGRKMAIHYEKLNKGVVIIQCVSHPGETKKLVDIVTTMIQSDPSTFSGQTFYI